MAKSSSGFKNFVFQGVVYKLGVLRCVDLPKRLEKPLGAKAKLAVSGRLAGVRPFEGALVPKKEGGFRLYLKVAHLRAVGVDTGETVRVELRSNNKARKPNMPADFARALSKRKGAKAAFESLPPSHRREFIDWLNAAVKPKTRARRLEKAVGMALEQAERRASRRAARFL